MRVRVVRLRKDGAEGFKELLFGFFKELRDKQGWGPLSRKEIDLETQKILRSKDIVIMAYEDENPIGFIRISTRNEDSVFWIEEIFVKSEFRRRGVARMLVKAAEKEVIKRGEVSLYLYVLPQDKVAISFWRAMGYTILNSIELVKDLKPIKRDKELLSLELLGEEFKMFNWTKLQFDELGTEFIKLLKRFYAEGGNRELFLKLINNLLKDYLKGSV